MEMVEVEMPPGRTITMPSSAYNRIRQLLWIQSGALHVTECGETHVLEAGDCLGFGPPSEVTLANKGKKPCRYVVSLTRS
jgi:uncharacterized cupin superfamily protein